MPKHLAIGQNIISGNVSFDNQKTKNILFDVPLLSTPQITLTLDSSTQAPPYRINASKNGFTIKFPINYEGNIYWMAIQL